MAGNHLDSDPMKHRSVFAMLAVCCAVPMVAVVVLTSVVGLAVGWAAAIALGVVAAGVGVAVMIQHHQRTKGVGDR